MGGSYRLLDRTQLNPPSSWDGIFQPFFQGKHQHSLKIAILAFPDPFFPQNLRRKLFGSAQEITDLSVLKGT